VSIKELGRNALTVIVSEVSNRDSDVRALSCEILGEIGNRSAVKLLKERLSDPSKYVQISAAGALYKLGNKDGLSTLLGIIKNVPGRKPILNDPLLQMKVISHNKIREKAIEVFAQLVRKKSMKLLYALKRDEYGIVRDAASRQLAKLGDEEEIKKFIYALGDEDEGIRYEAARSLARICSDDSLHALKNQIKIETSIRVKIAILDSFLCVRKKKKIMMEMLKLSLSMNPTIKFKAVSVLSEIKQKGLPEKLEDIYRENKDLGVKLAAMKGMVLNGSRPDISLIKSGMRAKEEEIKELLLDLLELLSFQKAKPFLIDLLKDPNYKIRLYAAGQILKRLAKK